MSSKASKARLLISLATTLFLLFTISLSAQARDGTDGTEMQIATPEQLEVQLGTAWAGVEFQLKTEHGLYPGTIPVGDDGVLRLEIGGSSSYQLTCLTSKAPVPTPKPTPEPVTSAVLTNQPDSKAESGEEQQPGSQPQATITATETGSVDPAFTLADIPIWQLGLLGGGMVVAIGALIVMAVLKKRRVSEDEDEDDGL
ncbi:hypothetical protein AALA61_12700 [Oscillospiraceae bacterium 42-9]|nr:hypothetical protein [Acutalibacter sp. 1XD8-36]